ncbi:hypothetical protein [Sphingomonas sp. LHG3406-1]|uniref:hypothetical protein n=1 Tax=Sphingomonas sp. LHG3406-1 TaxID=2804617 RepID=UPI00262FCD8A|nr:hypothetical protein [Sphingomonas sp. LHG3406-1]
MDKHLADRLFDPTFNDCSSDEEFDLAWTVQARLTDALRGGRSRAAQPQKPAETIRRRQAAERDAEARLREQQERIVPAVHFFEDADEPDYAAVRRRATRTPARIGRPGTAKTPSHRRKHRHPRALAAAARALQPRLGLLEAAIAERPDR